MKTLFLTLLSIFIINPVFADGLEYSRFLQTITELNTVNLVNNARHDTIEEMSKHVIIDHKKGTETDCVAKNRA